MSIIELETKLRDILKISKCNHKKEILKEVDIKHAHIYCKINQLNGQITGSLIEEYIKNKYNMIKNKTSNCNGDLNKCNKNYEIKVSLGGKNHDKFNYVQLRMNHDCIYLLTAYYINNKNIKNLGELFMFELTKEDIKNIIVKYGSYAHGTIKKLGIITIDDLGNESNTKEYALRPKFGDKCWNELLKFRIECIDQRVQLDP